MAAPARARVRTRTPTFDKEAAKERYIALSYQIIEYKLMYYYPELVRPGFHKGLTISDDAYDNLEIEYLQLCLKLGYENTVVHKDYEHIGEVPGAGMMEVDFTRPVVHLVMRKYGIPNWQKSVFGEEPAPKENPKKRKRKK